MANPRTQARIEARILERAATVLQTEVSDPRAGFITVTRVEMSSDLTSGKIYYSVLGTEGDRSKVERMLDDASGYLQRMIAPALQLRRTPHLRWYYDESLEYAQTMDQKIREALERDRSISGQADAATAEPADSGDPEADGSDAPAAGPRD